MLSTLASMRDLLLVALGFGLVIFIHELGHFLAARWAGVRVEQFAIGFGPAVVSYRKGIGWRRGSTTPELRKRLASNGVKAPVDGPLPRLEGVSPTEYRINWLPFGGYVKMLGQDDLRPGSRPDVPDSYSSKPVWKRMVIVTAGVVMNVLLACVIFVGVFMKGLDVEAPVVGEVAARSGAALAEPMNREGVGVGLRTGDRIVSIDAEGERGALDRLLSPNGREIRSFSDVALASAMSRGEETLRVRVERPGVDGTITFQAKPTTNERTRLRELGVYPATSTRLYEESEIALSSRQRWRMEMDRSGLGSVPGGSRLETVNGEVVALGSELQSAAERSEGRPLELAFRTPKGERVIASVRPTYGWSFVPVTVSEGEAARSQPHALGVLPALGVESVEGAAEEAGLLPGDVLARVGSVEWPDLALGVAEIQRHAGKRVSLTVLRAGAYVEMSAEVDARRKAIGFIPTTVADGPPILAGTMSSRHSSLSAAGAPERDSVWMEGQPPVPAGARVLRVGDVAVSTMNEFRDALAGATREALAADRGAEVRLVVRLPLGEEPDTGPTEEMTWVMTGEQVAALHRLGWSSPVALGLFDLEQTTLKGETPWAALGMGLHETDRVMRTVYLTLVRLFEGTVKVQHLKGPVGIAHIGTIVAERGMLHLIFFLGLISVNLAVVNLLPIPIADGGLLVFLLIEGVTRKPVSPAIQNAATAVGLLLVVAVFLIVTFNDVAGILGG
ncbi:MAG: site-2 protease family protein [Phycisphaerales bacterium]